MNGERGIVTITNTHTHTHSNEDKWQKCCDSQPKNRENIVQKTHKAAYEKCLFLSQLDYVWLMIVFITLPDKIAKRKKEEKKRRPNSLC